MNFGPFKARHICMAVFASIALSGCKLEGVLDPQGPIGSQELLLMLDATAIMLAVVVPVIVLTLVCAWWFRSDNQRATYLPDWQYSGSIEMIVWSIPILIIGFLGGIAWIGAHNLDPYKKLESTQKPLEVEVVSLDWKWLFIYPEQHIAMVNRLVLPAGRPVHFRLTSQTVMNSFFIPQLGGQIYTMPRMVTQLNLIPDHPGTYEGLSSQFSGDGFSDMRFDTVVLPANGFAGWLQAAQANPMKLDARAFTELAKPGISKTPSTYGTVAPDLFDAVAGMRSPVTAMTTPRG
jgi:cytochrome o ubiquinol oxidase subunit 2